jgi:Sulfotransferase family
MSDAPVFVVGFPRSGTTLLSAMLSRHPRLAIAHEWRWVPDLLRPQSDGSLRRPAEVLEAALRAPKLGGEFVDAADARHRLAALHDPTPAGALRCVFEAYAAAAGKARWGDKTPRNLVELDILGTAFPDALFVHLIRDGREVADANRDAPWGGSGLLMWARRWARSVATARAAGLRLGPRYVEVRYEQLVARAEETLTALGEFLDAPFVDAQLDYPSAVAELGEALPAHHQNLRRPPTAGLRDWASTWTERERRAVEAVAGPVLDDLGYPRSVPLAASRRTAEAIALVEEAHHSIRLAWRDHAPTVSGVAARLGLRDGAP